MVVDSQQTDLEGADARCPVVEPTGNPLEETSHLRPLSSLQRNRPITTVGVIHLDDRSFTLGPEDETIGKLKGRIHVVLDEAFDPFTAVCAVVFTEQEYLEANLSVSQLRTDLSQSNYLSGLESYEEFVMRGFHAHKDTSEISTRFIDEAFKHMPGKAFIYYTDGQRRRDLSAKKTALLMYACVLQVIFRKYRSTSEVFLHFEQHEELDRFFQPLTELALHKSRGSMRVSVESCPKGEPASLALTDYILHIFGQSIDYISYGHEPVEKYQFRNLRAIKNHVSFIYSTERGRMASRRTPWPRRR